MRDDAVNEYMLEVKNVTAGYGKLQILNGMSIAVKRDSITAILGGNGCGKSTTLKAITGMLRVTGAGSTSRAGPWWASSPKTW